MSRSVIHGAIDNLLRSKASGLLELTYRRQLEEIIYQYGDEAYKRGKEEVYRIHHVLARFEAAYRAEYNSQENKIDGPQGVNSRKPQHDKPDGTDGAVRRTERREYRSGEAILGASTDDEAGVARRHVDPDRPGVYGAAPAQGAYDRPTLGSASYHPEAAAADAKLRAHRASTGQQAGSADPDSNHTARRFVPRGYSED